MLIHVVITVRFWSAHYTTYTQYLRVVSNLSSHSNWLALYGNLSALKDSEETLGFKLVREATDHSVCIWWYKQTTKTYLSKKFSKDTIRLICFGFTLFTFSAGGHQRQRHCCPRCWEEICSKAARGEDCPQDMCPGWACLHGICRYRHQNNLIQ